jgi:hypothetical protein
MQVGLDSMFLSSWGGFSFRMMGYLTSLVFVSNQMALFLLLRLALIARWSGDFSAAVLPANDEEDGGAAGSRTYARPWALLIADSALSMGRCSSLPFLILAMKTAIGIAANYIPAGRAARIDPMVALRIE